MKKSILLIAATLVILVAAFRIHSQEQESPKPNQVGQLGRFQVVFNPLASDQTYLLDTESGNVWWFKSDAGKKIAILVEKAK